MGERSQKMQIIPSTSIEASAEGEMLKHHVVLEGKIASSLPSVLATHQLQANGVQGHLLGGDCNTRSRREVPDAGRDALLLGLEK